MQKWKQKEAEWQRSKAEHAAKLAEQANTIEQLRDDVVNARSTTTGGAVSMIKTLLGVPLLQKLSDEVLAAVAGAIAVEHFEPGATIVQEGDPGESMYILVDGNAQAAVHGEVVAHFGAGDYFGEVALITSQPRMATVLCDTRTQCLVLDKSAFDIVAESNEYILAERLNTYDSTRQEAQGLLHMLASELTQC